MCDICQLKCLSCGRTVETHIGDFSVRRESVAVFCHKCKNSAIKHIFQPWPTEQIVFTDSGCSFIIELPRSIHLNGLRSECLGRVPISKKLLKHGTHQKENNHEKP